MVESPSFAQPDLQTALDFVNTAELERGRPVDHLDTTRAALAWLHEHAGMDAGEVPESTAVRARIVRARTAFRELWDAAVQGRPPDDAALHTINRVLRHQSQLQLQPSRIDGTAAGCGLVKLHTGDAVDCALGGLAEALARTLGSDAAERSRICANDECRYVFFDESRTHQRRWCDMASCGNRAKAARHRARARGGDTAPV